VSASSSDLGAPRLADQALRTIYAQRHADDVIRRVREGELDADALAVELAKSYGVNLQALARAVCKAVRGAI